jgi:hypothetical protein
MRNMIQWPCLIDLRPRKRKISTYNTAKPLMPAAEIAIGGANEVTAHSFHVALGERSSSSLGPVNRDLKRVELPDKEHYSEHAQRLLDGTDDQRVLDQLRFCSEFLSARRA